MAITYARSPDLRVASVGAAEPLATPHGVDATQEKAGRLLVDLFRYLEQHAVEHPALLPAITGLRDAIADYRSAASGSPLDGVRRVVGLIGEARVLDPVLPEP